MNNLFEEASRYEGTRLKVTPDLESAIHHMNISRNLLQSAEYLAFEQTGTDRGWLHDWHQGNLEISVVPEVAYHNIISLLKISKVIGHMALVLPDIHKLSRYAKQLDFKDHHAAALYILDKIDG